MDLRGLYYTYHMRKDLVVKLHASASIESINSVAPGSRFVSRFARVQSGLWQTHARLDRYWVRMRRVYSSIRYRDLLHISRPPWWLILFLVYDVGKCYDVKITCWCTRLSNSRGTASHYCLTIRHARSTSYHSCAEFILSLHVLASAKRYSPSRLLTLT